MKSILLSNLLLGSVIVAGCASGPQDSAGAAPERSDLVYRTGSNIPVREKAPLTPEEKEKRTEESQRSLQQLQRTGAGNPKP